MAYSTKIKVWGGGERTQQRRICDMPTGYLNRVLKQGGYPIEGPEGKPIICDLTSNQSKAISKTLALRNK